MAKLVVFYSRADENYFSGSRRYISIGNTEKVANMIAEIAGADLFKIEQKVPYAADYYTRTGLDYKQREMITFCFLAAQGGCELQLTSHAAANMRIGNNKAFLIKIISQCLPYIGYPRSLNALRCVNDAAGAN